MNLRRWLQVGMGMKRWLLVVFLGELCLALGGAFALRQLYHDPEISGPLQGLLVRLSGRRLAAQMPENLLALARAAEKKKA